MLKDLSSLLKAVAAREAAKTLKKLLRLTAPSVRDLEDINPAIKKMKQAGVSPNMFLLVLALRKMYEAKTPAEEMAEGLARKNIESVLGPLVKVLPENKLAELKNSVRASWLKLYKKLWAYFASPECPPFSGDTHAVEKWAEKYGQFEEEVIREIKNPILDDEAVKKEIDELTGPQAIMADMDCIAGRLENEGLLKEALEMDRIADLVEGDLPKG